MDSVTISDAARTVGLSVHAVRYCEAEGLIPPVPRDASGRRMFDKTSIDWLEYASCLRSLGMTVTQIRPYVAAATSPSKSREAERLMRDHLDAMRVRRVDLDQYIDMVERKLDAMSKRRR